MPENKKVVPVADMHCDTISEILAARRRGEACSLRSNRLHVDVEKLKRAGCLVQNFAMFLDLKETEQPWETCLQMIRLYREEIAANREEIAEMLSYNDLKKNREHGRISALLTVEEGEAAMGSLERLRLLYEQGVRMITLTWNYNNSVGHPNACLPDGTRLAYGIPNTEYGLTEFGVDFVQEMERLGMLVDVSHLSDAGFYDVLRVTRQPFVASHSNARSVCPHVRNMTDDMIKKLAERGGVMGINFCPFFLDKAQNGTQAVGTMDQIVAQIRYIQNLAGEDCIGIGSDFDGIPPHSEIRDAAELPRLADRLKREGFSETAIDKLFYKNVLRVYQAVLI